jgi:outer membrane protein OmpA-like peptidoglycan-associated protein
MKARLNMSFAVAGTSLILLTGCVSSKKYKRSEAELAKVRSDSAQLAQQVTSLNGNVHDLQERTTGLQRSLDSSSSRYSAQQRTLGYYQSYFKEQQDSMSQVSEDVKGALTQAGISNGDVQQMNNAIYVRFDENELFKKNSTMVTPVGKQVLDGLAQAIRSRSNVNVAVASGDSATGWVATDKMASDATMTAAPKHHRTAHASHRAVSGTSGGSGGAQNSSTGRARNSSTGGTQSNGAGSGSVAANSGTGGKSGTAPTHRKVHHSYSSEGSTAIYSGPGHMHNRAWALKQGRMVTVADHFLKNGVPKINVSLQQPPMNGTPQSSDIKIIIMPKMDNFNPQNSSSAATGSR